MLGNLPLCVNKQWHKLSYMPKTWKMIFFLLTLGVLLGPVAMKPFIGHNWGAKMTIDNLIAHICFIDYKRDAPQEILWLWLHFDPCSDFVWGSCDLFKYSQIHHRTKYPFVIFNMDNGSLSSRGGQPQNTFPFVNLSSPELYMCDPFKQLSWKCEIGRASCRERV